MNTKAKFILSKSKLHEQYQKLKSAGLTVSYSVKTNPTIVSILEEETDCFFSVHSSSGIAHVKDKSRIWFLADSWNVDEIRELVNEGVFRFIVYNRNDLDVLQSFLKDNNTKIDLLLRTKLKENSIFTEKYFVFGMNAKEINELIPMLKDNNNIMRLGIHFHRKTQNVSEWSLKYELSNILNKDTLKSINLINIGGGLPVMYRNTSDNALPGIFKKINELKSWLDSLGIETIIEPGRFLSGPAVKLETHVKNIEGKNITVNCSVYNSSMDTLIVPIKLFVDGETSENKSGVRYTIKGCTPCSLDIFRYSAILDEKKIGDKITFLNAGAYNFHTNFCGLDILETKIID